MKNLVSGFAVLLACFFARGAETTTTVEVKDGTVVVRSSTGEISIKDGEMAVVNDDHVIRQSVPVVSSRSSAKLTLNGKTFEVSSDTGSVSARSNNDQITITCGDLTLTGDTNTLKAGDKTYDVSKSSTVKITVKNGQVEVDTGGGNKQE